MPGGLSALGLAKKQSPAARAVKSADKASKAKIVHVHELEQQIRTLESATKKLAKGHQKGDKAGQDAAFQVKTAAERILGNLPSQDAKSSLLLGRQYPEQVRRLKRVVAENQLIWDEAMVELSKRKAGNLYLEAGRAARP